MANALEQNLIQLKSRVQNGPVGQFFRWWVEELKQALPAPWQAKLQHAMRRLTFEVSDGSLVLAVDENHQLSVVGELLASPDKSLQKQQVADLAEQNELTEAPRILLIDAGRFLVKEISLPMAAEPNLRQVLTFEMDRQTPFKASGVYFDWKILERGGPGGQLSLRLYVIPRTEIDGNVEVLGELGKQLSGIDIREDDQTLGVNLLPQEQRLRVVNRKARTNYVLAGAVVVLLALTMTFSLYLRKHQVAQLEDAIADVRGEANQVARIRSQIEGASEAAGFLAMRRAESPLAVELLADVTRILPDDTYLDRLVINKSSVQMQGKSQNAQRLIELVNESGFLEAASFRGSTRLDARTGLEIFEINAEISANPQVSAAGGSDGSGA